MGLLAQLENEAQLAFILCHEIVHVEQNHNLEIFLEAKNIQRNIGNKQLLSELSYKNYLVEKK